MHPIPRGSKPSEGSQNEANRGVQDVRRAAGPLRARRRAWLCVRACVRGDGGRINSFTRGGSWRFPRKEGDDDGPWASKAGAHTNLLPHSRDGRMGERRRYCSEGAETIPELNTLPAAASIAKGSRRRMTKKDGGPPAQEEDGHILACVVQDGQSYSATPFSAHLASSRGVEMPLVCLHLL